MPSAIKKAREFGDDLAIIFVESQGATQERMERFAWDRGWMGTTSMWTREAPFRTGSRGLPNFALIGADGKILMKGHPMSMQSKVVKAIEEEIKKGKGAPDGAPRSLKSAYKALAKGDYSKALASAGKIAARAGDDAAAAQAFVEAADTRFDKNLKRVEYLLSNGYALRADALYDELRAGAKGNDDLEARAAALAGSMASDEVADEMKLDKTFSKIEEKLHEDGLDEKLLKKVRKLAEKNEGSRVMQRARRILDLAS